ncbi:YhcN/YlaJ family sporulation lipoprotein [Aquibacillus saliphilus]|uniref:YhcN/YlaJ family sporulation lipoprotein n=1 Tax=Aquibacillus saliphilus TaxID=1909422 RepID=UPI001CEFD8E9|nr:YhcN/YlaJ family sporulation lipoprotein [Aquibacillus saliphilus]
MNWKSIGLTVVASLTLTACGVDNNETGQGLDDGVQQTRFGNTTDFPMNNRDNQYGQYQNTRFGTERNGAGMQDATRNGTYDGGNVRNDNNTGTRNGLNNINNQTEMNRNNTTNNNDENRFEVADKVSDRIVKKVNAIDNAYVLTTDNNAYVAVELDRDTNNNNNKNGGNGDNVSESIEKQIRDVVKNVDSDIDNVYVSTNPDFVNLTNNYRDDVENGEPIEGFFDQMGQMIERVFPDAR